MDEKEFAKTVAMEAAVVRKSLNNLMGIVNGLVCDNNLTDTEVQFLATWLEENRHIADTYPANIVFRRVSEVMADGVITDAERADLLADLKVISGNDFMESGAALPDNIASVFDDDPFVEVPRKALRPYRQVLVRKSRILKASHPQARWYGCKQREPTHKLPCCRFAKDVETSVPMLELLAESEFAADMTYYLGMNKAESARIARLPFLDQAVAIKEIEKQVRAKQ